MANLELKDLTNDDLSMYFKDSYVRLVIPSKNFDRWLYCHSVGAGIVSFYDGAIGAGPAAIKTLKIQKKSDAFIQSEFPSGFFNYQKSSVLGARTAARQNCKGISAGSYKFYRMENVILTSRYFSKDKLEGTEAGAAIGMMMKKTSFIINDTNIINEFFGDKSTIPPLVAREQILSGEFFSRAVNRHFAMIPNPLGKDVMILHRDCPAAVFKDKANLSLITPAFAKELQTLLPSIHIHE